MEQKADALKEISLLLNVPLNDVEKKIKNINNQYARERRNYKKLKKSGAWKHFTPKWFGYELLSFLRDKNKPRKSLQAGCSGETHESDSSQSSIYETEPDDTENILSQSQQTTDIETMQNMEAEPTEMTTDELNTSSITAKEKGKVKDIKKTFEKATINKAYKQKDISQNIERRNEEVYNIVTSLQKDRLERSRNKPDKFDIIGELVAQKLRCLPTPYAQSTVEHLIHNLLYDAEMGKYNNDPKKPQISQVQRQMKEFLRFPTGFSGSSYSTPLSVKTNLHSTLRNFNTQHSYPNPSSTDTQNSYPNPSSTDTQNSYPNPPSIDTQHSYSNPPSIDTQHLYSNPPNMNTQNSYSNPPSIDTHLYSNPPNLNTQHSYSNPPSADPQRSQYFSDQENEWN
nr:unnamed protein product [Callosobruchus analis]